MHVCRLMLYRVAHPDTTGIIYKKIGFGAASVKTLPQLNCTRMKLSLRKNAEKYGSNNCHHDVT